MPGNNFQVAKYHYYSTLKTGLADNPMTWTNYSLVQQLYWHKSGKFNQFIFKKEIKAI